MDGRSTVLVPFEAGVTSCVEPPCLKSLLSPLEVGSVAGFSPAVEDPDERSGVTSEDPSGVGVEVPLPVGVVGVGVGVG